MIAIHINCKRLDKAHFIAGDNGALYADLLLFENKTPDKYGNAGFVVQSVGKDVRERGERGPIVGNWKIIGKDAPKTTPPAQPQGDDALPF